jgi:hypothetical protein
MSNNYMMYNFAGKTKTGSLFDDELWDPSVALRG